MSSFPRSVCENGKDHSHGASETASEIDPTFEVNVVVEVADASVSVNKSSFFTIEIIFACIKTILTLSPSRYEWALMGRKA